MRMTFKMYEYIPCPHLWFNFHEKRQHFYVKLLTGEQTDKQIDRQTDKHRVNIISLEEVILLHLICVASYMAYNKQITQRTHPA